MFTYRTLPKTEFDQYAEFLKARTPASLRTYFGMTVSPSAITRLTNNIVDGDALHFVCTVNHNGEIVGTVHVAPETSNQAEFGIMVAEDFRQQGLADLLIDYARDECAKVGIDSVRVMVDPSNLPMRRLARKHNLPIVH